MRVLGRKNWLGLFTATLLVTNPPFVCEVVGLVVGVIRRLSNAARIRQVCCCCAAHRYPLNVFGWSVGCRLV